LCYGDSGGPATQEGRLGPELVGGTSRGTSEPECATGPTIDTDITRHRAWIVRVILGLPAGADTRQVEATVLP